jgi:hypothetical protein
MLNGYDLLHALGLGNQFQLHLGLDPVSHFDINPGDYGWMDEDAAKEWVMQQRYEEDYNND